MSQDWYRRTTWTKKDQDEFYARLDRSRGQFHKAQYLRIQASYLEKKSPATSLELLRRVISEFPEPSELAQTYLQMAHCHVSLSDEENAIRCFRKALETEEEYPSSLTGAYLDFPTFIVVTNRASLFKEADDVLSKNISRLMFPVHHYQFHMCKAIIAEHNGLMDKASQHASGALSAAVEQHSGFRYHPKVGLVKKTR